MLRVSTRCPLSSALSEGASFMSLYHDYNVVQERATDDIDIYLGSEKTVTLRLRNHFPLKPRIGLGGKEHRTRLHCLHRGPFSLFRLVRVIPGADAIKS